MVAESSSLQGPRSVLLLGVGDAAVVPGGLERYAAGLHMAIRHAGAVVISVVVGPAAADSDHVVVADRDDPIPRRLYRYWRGALRAGASADLIDAHFALYALLPTRLGRLRRLPLVVHFHGPWVDESDHSQRGKVDSSVRRSIERAVYRRASLVVTLSGAFQRLVVERYRVQPWRVRVVRPGVDLNAFTPGVRSAARGELALPLGGPVVVATRRLIPRMGLDVLLDSWVAVLDRHPDAVLLVVGDGPLRAVLEDLALSLGVSNSVRFLGRVDDGTLVSAYRAADVAVVPSVGLEGYGLVVLEAMACGIPVITTDVGGLPEAAGPCGHELVVPANDADQLGARLSEALEGSVALPSPAQCREHALSHTWEQAARRHLALYDDLLDSQPRRRRVVFLDHCARLSGAEIALLRLAPELARDHDVHIVLGEEGPLVGALCAAGVSVEVLALPAGTADVGRARALAFGAVGAQLRALVFALRLARLLRRYGPDVVHGNSLKACFYGSVAARLAGIPFVWHARDRLAADYLPRPAAAAGRALARGLSAAVIANSTETLRTLGRARRLDAAKRRVVIGDPIPQGPITCLAPSDGFTAGMVGRVAPWKGQDIFLKAFALAFPEGPERAIVVGAAMFGEDDYEAELHSRWGAPPWSSRIEFRGFVRDVRTELSRFSALVHASVVPEPFGMVVAEGMSAGLPVIASAAGGPLDVISDGVDGLLVPPGDVNALATALRRLADDPDRAGALGAAAQRSAQRFAPGVVADEVRRVYDEVLGKGR